MAATVTATTTEAACHDRSNARVTCFTSKAGGSSRQALGSMLMMRVGEKDVIKSSS